ncbi:MAG TPA: 1-deoxy-D-xylulose-5-phosphate reductoisomerase [Gemmatimonadaceae bacterium]|nr:1-deoxy-D-xylulose-5-phosphate reductoisomerase [Gemmatimonadaceae bacterium]
MSQRGIAILGSTGSIGTATLRVIARHTDRFRVIALTAFGNATLLREQARSIHPQYVGIVAPSGDADRTWATGAECLIEAATRPDVDIVVNAIVGAAGLQATLAALRAGKRVALANKESLVIGGELVLHACREGGGEIIPVDSEHSAIMQCIGARLESEVSRLIITASGGPFREWDVARIAKATIQDALNHPTWTMGRKITVDSATLANKALEVIEAHYLFGVPYDRIDVVVHPQSIIHSFVEFVDGSVLAQLGFPTMELPILYALTHPDRIADAPARRFDPAAASPLTFEPVDVGRFPSLALGIQAGCSGGAAPAVFNGANEQAVCLFLAGTIGFADVPRAIESALAAHGGLPADSIDDVTAADAAARVHVGELFR